MIKAFSTAYGAGANSLGARGQAVYHVTNLNNEGAGSFRDAVSTGNRFIVFDVSGVITLTSMIDKVIDNTTIAGQTAPAGGISFTGATVILKGNNVIVRYLRFRGSGFNTDSFNGYYLTNSIIDHISASFGQDEAASFLTDTALDFNNVTIQNCFFAESSTGSIIGSAGDFYERVGGVSFLNNLFYNISHRFPNIGGDGRFDVINNVAWNMDKRNVRGNGDFQLNHIGNYYDYGTPIHDEIVNHYAYASGDTPEIYTSDNFIFSRDGVRIGDGFTLASTIAEMNADNFLSWKWFIDGAANGTNRGDQLPLSIKSNTQFALLGQSFTPLTGEQAFDAIPNKSGAYKSLNADGTISINRDSYEIDWLNNIATNTQVPELIEPYPVPTLPTVSRPASYYNEAKSADIPEVWFDANVPSGQSSTDLAPSGYMWIEEFVNQVDGDAVVINIPQITRTDANPTSIVQGGVYTAPTGTWTDVEDGSGTATVGGDTVDVNTVGTYNVTLFHTDTEGNTGSLTIQYTITPDTPPPPPTTGKLSIQIKILISQ